MNRHRHALIAVAVLAAALATGGTADAASLEGEVSFSDGSGAITSGGSGDFSMSVPPGSACQGPGSLGYRWETFLVSDDVEVADLTFTAGPTPIDGSVVVPLFDLNGDQVSTKFPSAVPLGLISGIPAISLPNTVSGGGLAGIPAGGYRIGVACTFQNAVQEYWATYLEVTADAEDSPLGISWAASEEPPPPTTVPPSSSTPDSSVPDDTSTTTVPTTTDPTDGVTTTTDVEQLAGTPAAGGDTTPMVVLALLALVAGRATILAARRVKVLPPQ